MPIRKEIFVLILGHGRSGTTVCTSLLNMSPDFNIGFELWNNHIAGEQPKNLVKKNIVLSDEYNGNKVIPHPEVFYESIMECIDKGLLITHKNYKILKVIFVKRNYYSTIMSQQKRIGIKQGKDIPIENLVYKYIEVERTIIRLKKAFPDYHNFDFDKAVGCELHRKWLFDYVGSEYHPIFSESYIGGHNYPYGSLKDSNTMFKDPDKFPELKDEIDKNFANKRFWPMAGSNYV